MDFSYRLDKSELFYGLHHLSLDNLNGFLVEDLAISASSEVSVTNVLQDNDQIPKFYFIVSQEGDGKVLKGDSDWTTTTLYFKNTGSNAVTVSIFILGDL